MKGWGGVVWKEGQDEETNRQHQSLKASRDSPLVRWVLQRLRTLREQGRKSMACSVSARGQKERRKGGRIEGRLL